MRKKTTKYLGNQTSSPLGRLGEAFPLGRLGEAFPLGRLGEAFVFLLLVMFSVTSCSDDDTLTPDNHFDGGETQVTLNISAQAPDDAEGAGTRAVYEDGTAEEMMHNWIILVTRNDSIKRIFKSEDYQGTRKEDAVTTRLDNGEYTFYSFANIPLENLGLTDASTTLPADFDNRNYTANGNQQSIAGFPNGIPMSNKQTVTITSTTSRVDLSVIRMVVKMRMSLTNTSGDSMRVKHITITDITRNFDDNVKLLPGAINNDSTGKRTANISSAVGDFDPDHKITFSYDVPDSIQNLNANETRNYEFYVNESQARSDLNHFVVGIESDYTVRNTFGAVDSTVSRWRYAIIDFNNVARNEIHYLPIGLMRYRIEFYVRPFTAIGVLPKYDMESEIASIEFGLYGHYDIIPRIHDMVTGVYYYTQNYTSRQNVTVTNVDPDHEAKDMKIDSLKLLTDSRNLGIPYDMGGWESEDPADVDANGNKRKHYPTVGWNITALTPRIECVVGNYTGWAIYTVNASFTVTGSQTPIFLTRRFRISNHYVDLSQLAKRYKW